MTADQFAQLINLIFVGICVLCFVIGYRIGSAWQ